MVKVALLVTRTFFRKKYFLSAVSFISADIFPSSTTSVSVPGLVVESPSPSTSILRQELMSIPAITEKRTNFFICFIVIELFEFIIERKTEVGTIVPANRYCIRRIFTTIIKLLIIIHIMIV